MSDHPSAQDAMSALLRRQRCNGAPGCPCASSSSSSKNSGTSSSSGTASSPSPSGSRTRSTHATATASSAGDSVRSSTPLPQEPSDSEVPEGEPVQEWSGLERVTIGKCEHGRRCVLKKCSVGKHTGRRFLGCPMQDEEVQCPFKEWVEDPWPQRIQSILKALCLELKATKRGEAKANKAVIKALSIQQIATETNDNLVKKVERTKQTAHDVCKVYYGKTQDADKRNGFLMNLIYCLIGVIAFLVAVILYLLN